MAMLRKTYRAYDTAMSNNTPLMRTVWKTAALFRTKIVKTLGARVQYGKEHIEVRRYSEVQAYVVPEDWYRRACEALGEGDRLPSVPDPEDQEDSHA